jgi:small nuclear ribonucleoprotein (snRNP)-like protein
MDKSPYEYLKMHVGETVEIHTYDKKVISGILKGVDVYVNVYLSQAKNEEVIGDVIINGSNVMYFNLL